MDKQTGWTASDDCACVGEKCVVKFIGVECKPVAFVDLQELAQVEEQAAKVPALTGLLKDLLGECYSTSAMVEGAPFESRGAPSMETCRKVAAYLKEMSKGV